MDEASMKRLWSTPSHDGLDETRALADAKRRILGRGAPLHLHRYLLGARLGRGGGGTVYRAHDPVLRRDVAIKVVVARADRRVGIDDCRRLMREAQVLAQLSHPNLVPIYDVGWLPSPHLGVFVVMELVDGGDLHAWLLERRPWQDVVARFLSAAEGLAAAHARGIVHRDFKPANVLCCADRVLVADFGLARREPTGVDSTDGASEDPPGSRDDVTGRDAVVGTPRYMAPEQHEGAALDVRVDVYAFCAALYEAICGTPPFLGSTAQALRDKKRREAIEPPVRTEAPAALVRVLRRGLAADLHRRWPDMPRLVAAITAAIDRKRPRRRAALGLALGLGATGFIAMGDMDPCAQRGRAIAERWSPAVQQEVERAFASTGAPFARASLDAGRGALSHYVDALGDEAVAACKASHVDRIACVSAGEAAVGEVVSGWIEADVAIVERARLTVDGLPAIGCAPRGANAPEDLPGVLARVQARHALGRFRDGLDLVERTMARRDVAASARARAELRVWRGRLLAEEGQLEAAARDVRAGYFAAVDEDAPEIAVLAASTLVDIEGAVLGRTEEGLSWGRHALALADRLGDPVWRGRVLDNVGEIHAMRGEDRRALAMHEEALALLSAAHGTASIGVAIALNRIGNAHRNLGELDAAAVAYERAHAIFALDGDSHPRALMVVSNLGNVELDRGRPEAARDRFETAAAGLRRALGPDHRSVGTAENGLANALWHAGAHDEAVAHYQTARAIYERALGPDHADTAAVRYNLASRLVELGRHDAARRELREAAAIFERLPGASAGLYTVLVAWGAMERDAGNDAAAYELLARSVALAPTEAQRSGVADVQAVLAELALALGHTRDAEVHVARARDEYRAVGDDAGLARVAAWAAEQL
jgi:tetratricopeptide (TPR) repeat protein/tRNA A-37 threonylcarbamoyl transferase component Bud32